MAIFSFHGQTSMHNDDIKMNLVQPLSNIYILLLTYRVRLMCSQNLCLEKLNDFQKNITFLALEFGGLHIYVCDRCLIR